MTAIQIASPPGPLCDQVVQRIKQVQQKYEFDCSVELVSEFEAIMGLQVYSVPGLLIDGVLKSVGRVPEISELIDWLELDRIESYADMNEKDGRIK